MDLLTSIQRQVLVAEMEMQILSPQTLTVICLEELQQDEEEKLKKKKRKRKQYCVRPWLARRNLFG